MSPFQHPTPLTLNPIGIIHSPYQEKFAVPRQANLVNVPAILELLAPYNVPEAVRGLEDFSHLWLIFQFHHIPQGKWQPTVRPPRLGGNQRVGVFASRATHRPNPLGLSKVALERIDCSQGTVKLHLQGGDLVDGTPIFDIKPYLAFADSEPNARCGFAQEKPPASLAVEFSPQALQFLQGCNVPQFAEFIRQVLSQDPRPAYQKRQGRERIYGVQLYQHNVRFCVQEYHDVEQILVIDITAC